MALRKLAKGWHTGLVSRLWYKCCVFGCVMAWKFSAW